MMEGGEEVCQRRCHSSSCPGDGEAQPPLHKISHSAPDEATFPSHSGISQSPELEDSFRSSVFKKILPVLVKALRKEKVSKDSLALSGSDVSSDEDVNNVSQPVVSQALSHDQIVNLHTKIMLFLQKFPKLMIGFY